MKTVANDELLHEQALLAGTVSWDGWGEELGNATLFKSSQRQEFHDVCDRPYYSIIV